MKAWPASALVLLAALTHTLAASASPIQGLGATSCADFAFQYRKNPEMWELSYFTWAQGYMSGLNISAMGNGNRARDLGGDFSLQKQKLRAFCDQAPLKTYMNAVIDLWKSLPPTD